MWFKNTGLSANFFVALCAFFVKLCVIVFWYHSAAQRRDSAKLVLTLPIFRYTKSLSA